MNFILFLQILNSFDDEGFLLSDVMAFSPLWSMIHEDHGGILSNAEVENHFLSVKRNTKTGSGPFIAAFIVDRFKTVKRRTIRIVTHSYLMRIHYKHI